MNIYRYKVELNINEDTVFESGILFASSLTEAVEKMEENFGYDFVAIHMLKLIGDNSFCSLDEGVIDEIEKDWIW